MFECHTARPRDLRFPGKPTQRILAGVVSGLLVGSAFGQGSVMLVGGGSENYNDWSDAPYAWFVHQADSGKIINIDVGDASTWYPGYFRWLGADAASHPMEIPTRGVANDSTTYRELVSAKGIFLEGGDQWDYVATWKGTLVEDAIHQVFASGGAIGGTSAGCAVLGEVVFDARFGSAYPEQVAYNAYHTRVSFTDDFLDILPGVLTDSHFNARGRIGRLIPFLARRIQDFGDETLIGVGVEEYTAFCVDPDRIGTVWGDEVTIVRGADDAVIICEPSRPVTFSPVAVDQLVEGTVYDLSQRALLAPGPFLQPVSELPSPPVYAEILLDGSREDTGQMGEIVITGMTSDDDNWWQGDLGQVPGQGIAPRSVIIPRVWSDPDFFANRWIGGMYGVATHPGFLGIWLDDGCLTEIAPGGLLRVDRLTYVLESWRVTHAGIDDNHIPGFIGARYHALGPGDSLDLSSLDAPPLQGDMLPVLALRGVFPSPLTAGATLRVWCPVSGELTLTVCDLGGRLMSRQACVPVVSGANTVVWRFDLPSGTYCLTLQKDSARVTTPIVVTH